ncbi:MAG: hypothetical protein KDL87_11290 [Verrucomicrobiae bacterium]|nr:hypothetical protein [Verrucomicrobiae bacterium]
MNTPPDLIRRSVLPLILAGVALLMPSCIENSTVIRVRKDGGGEIFARYHFSPQMTGMLGMMNGLAASGLQVEGAESAKPPQMPTADSLLKPSQESLEQGASAYGEGVKFVRQEPGKNAAGWDGYLAVYQFDDINKLSFDPNNPPGPLNDLAKMNPEAAAELKKQTDGKDPGVKFTMADGTLTIDTGMNTESIKKISEGAGGGLGGGDSPLSGPNGAQIDPAAAMQMAAGMFQGMRLAYFIRIDGEIAETNATHVEDTLITMTDMQPAKMMTDPKFAEIIKQGEQFQTTEPTEAQVQEMMEKVEALDGVTIEAQKQIFVRFK